jgi:hypothetical protein
VDVPITPTSLADLLDKSMRHTSAVGLQAPETNTQTVFFGTAKTQPLELRPKANAALPLVNFKEVYVRGTSGDKLSVVLFDGK